MSRVDSPVATGIKVFILALSLLVVSYFAASALVHGLEKQDLNKQFAGACAVKGGAVHGDLCVKDGRVVLTEDGLKKILQGS